MELFGFTLETLGKVMIGYMAIRVHHRFWKEHKVDKKVFAEMRREQIVGIIGILFIIAGYIIQIPFKG